MSARTYPEGCCKRCGEPRMFRPCANCDLRRQMDGELP